MLLWPRSRSRTGAHEGFMGHHRRDSGRELAYYRADEPYLTVDKCAERCRMLPLLTAAVATADE
jgi:hypothetical protein